MPSNPLDPRFESLKALFGKGEPQDPALPRGHRQAAVSLVLRSRETLEVLLIRRSHAEADPWSGQMALPGGKRDAEDPSLLHTAIRETLEETGVALGREGEHLGRLTRVDPATRRLPPLTITPYVFGVPGDTRAAVASDEVDAVFWIPLSLLRDPDSAGLFRLEAGKFVRRFPAFFVMDQVVWGLTYRVLEEFLGKVDGL